MEGDQAMFDVTDIFKGKQEDVITQYGTLKVTVYGDRSKTPCIAYHDVGLNHRTCFQSLLVASGPQSLIMKNFYMIFIDAPGCEPPCAGESALDSSKRLSLVEMMSQITDVLAHFKVKECLGLGVGTGAYLLALHASTFSAKSPFVGLILISPCCKKSGWWEWMSGSWTASRLEKFGWSKGTKNHFIQRLFAPATTQVLGGDSDLMKAFRRNIQGIDPKGVAHYLRACLGRSDIRALLHNISCRVLLVYGAQGMYQSDCLELASSVNKSRFALVEIDRAGVLVNEERPMDLLSPFQLFLTALQLEGFGLGLSLEVGQ